MAATLEVVTPGLLTTVQDLGRPHAARHAVPAGGAMDAFALQAANRLVGNSPDAAALEITAGSAAFGVLAPAVIAITGADFTPTLDFHPVPLWASFVVRPGAQLSFAGRRGDWGARVYLAVAGGIDVPAVLGSRSTDLAGRFGGLDGRMLQVGDVLSAPTSRSLDLLAGRLWPEAMRPAYRAQPYLRVLLGPHLDRFTPDSLAALFSATLHVAVQSNRIGYRLDGPKLAYAHTGGLPSLGVVIGALQAPPDGTPILLMADAQTTGGYPIVGAVIRADLPLAAQLLPGDGLRLVPASEQAAVVAWRQYHDWLADGAIRNEPDEVELALAWAGALG